MNTWFDRRHCVICNHPPTSLEHPTIPDSIISQLFEEQSPSIPSSSPSTTNTTNTNTKSNTLQPISDDAITIRFKNKALTLSLPSLPNITVSKPKPGTGPTFKCKQCFARVHLDCIDSSTNNNIVCPVCIGAASAITQSNYKLLEESIHEENNLLRDWSHNECVACGDVGNLICCDLCFYEHNNDDNNSINSKLFITGNTAKVDGAAQFHLKCVIKPNTEFCGVYNVPDPFICPICTREFGANRLQSLHFFQRKRMKEREHRMQEKALKAQEYIKQIGFTVDSIKKCVFCRVCSDDTANGVFFDRENEFIGEFYDSQKRIKYWAHYQCVMWSPQCFMNANNEFENVLMEIKRSRSLTCCVCGKNGAVLGCYEAGCYNTYHYQCAKDDHCYFDNDLFAIYCPQHYFVHFLVNDINNMAIKKHRVYGMNQELFEKCRFDKSILGKRKIAKLCKSTDFCIRYQSAVHVWKFIMRQKHKHSTSSSISPSISKEASLSIPNNTTYLTRAKKKQIESYNKKKLERKKKKYRKSLMSFGGRKRSRSDSYLNGNLINANNEEKQLSPHEIKRRKVFNLEPKLINDKTVNIRIEPDSIDIGDIDNEYEMSSMIGGLDDAINVLKETVLLPLLYPELFKSFNLKPAKGVILYGPPGTGKTLLVRSLIKYYYAMSKAVFNNNNTPNTSPKRAKSISISSPSPKATKDPNKRYNSLADAVAVDHKNEDDVELRSHKSLISFFSRRGPDLLSKFHGETERNLRSLFLRAQELSPSIIFFDEMDGMAPIRSHKHEQVNNSVVATLLSLMDGLHLNNKEKDESDKVFVIAATNRIDNLDPALRRPGRFDREIYIGIPNAKQRHKILKIHTKNWNIDGNAFDDYLKYISINKTRGFSGADLKALCTETFMNCIHRLCPELKQCREYKESIANKLKTENIIISINDFKKTFNDGFKSSNHRNNVNQHKTFDEKDIDDLSVNAKKTLDELVERMDIYINRSKNSGSVASKKEIDDDDYYIRSTTQCRLISQYNDRILICSKNCDLNKLFVSYLLYKLDIANVEYVSIPMIAAHQYNNSEIYHTVLNKIKSSITSGIGVLVIYDLDIWLQFYPKLIETILLSNINEMCRDRNTLLLATSNKEWNATNCWQNQWSQNVYQYFSKFKHNFHINS